MTGTVYLIRAGRHCKIGSTAGSVTARLRNLQTGSPVRLRELLAIETKNHETLEAALHRHFHEQRTSGEWFRLSRDDIKWLLTLDGEWEHTAPSLFRNWNGIPRPPIAALSSVEGSPMRLREAVNREVSKALKESGISNAELARRMKCSPVTSLLMVQAPRNLQLDSLEKLAKALGGKVSVVITLNGKKK